MKIQYSVDPIALWKYATPKSSTKNTDYFWFLTSLHESIKKNYKVEIFDSNKKNYINYKIKDFIVDYTPGEEGQKDSVFINLEDIKTKKFKKLDLENIEDVEENQNSIPGEFYKYYVKLNNNKYRFVIFCKTS